MRNLHVKKGTNKGDIRLFDEPRIAWYVLPVKMRAPVAFKGGMYGYWH